MDWEKLVRFCLFWQFSQISPLSKPFFAFPSALMPGYYKKMENWKESLPVKVAIELKKYSNE